MLNNLCQATSPFDRCKAIGFAQICHDTHKYKSSLELLVRLKREDRGVSQNLTTVVEIIKKVKQVLTFCRNYTEAYAESHSLEAWSDASLCSTHLEAVDFVSHEFVEPVLSSVKLRSGTILINPPRDRVFFQNIQRKLNEYFASMGISDSDLFRHKMDNLFNDLELGNEREAEKKDEKTSPLSGEAGSSVKDEESKKEQKKDLCSNQKKDLEAVQARLQALSEKARSESIHQLIPQIRSFLIFVYETILQIQETQLPLEHQRIVAIHLKIRALEQLLEQSKVAKEVPMLVLYHLIDL